MFAYKIQAVFDGLLFVYLTCLGYFREWPEMCLDSLGWVFVNVSSPECTRDSGGRMENMCIKHSTSYIL